MGYKFLVRLSQNHVFVVSYLAKSLAMKYFLPITVNGKEREVLLEQLKAWVFIGKHRLL